MLRFIGFVLLIQLVTAILVGAFVWLIIRYPRIRRLLVGAFQKLAILFARVLNFFFSWHRLPTWMGLLCVYMFREDLRRKNLYDTDRQPGPDAPPAAKPLPHQLHWRSIDGRFNDLSKPEMGADLARFGRNMPVDHCYPETEPGLLSPNPKLVADRLLTRQQFMPAESLNLLAAAWIQFQTHDWFRHMASRTEGDDILIDLADDDPWPDPGRKMRIRRTASDPLRGDEEKGLPPTFQNRSSHWWDLSSIYGANESQLGELRSFEEGKLVIGADGFLPLDTSLDPQGRPLNIIKTGVHANWWVGLDLLHTLFTLEHNAICDELRRKYPAWNDERLFQTARLINAALNAKIHTVEWTPGILAHPVLRVGMDANWWGLFGERIYKALGRLNDSEALSGIMGSPVNHHAAPFSLTEEFVSVYRLHPLIPEELVIFRAETGERFGDPLPFKDIQGEHAFKVFGKPPGPPTMADLFYSFGIAHPGAIRLHNYPSFLRNFFARDPESNELRRVDVATVDIMRDRERGVPRYNQFLRLLRKRPLKSFDQMSDNPQWNAEMREVYNNDIERVDLMIGLMCEPLPKGFGFSDTAFRIFILMASRRLKSDRFFTNDYTADIYSKVGLAWINENDMQSVLLRHFPQLAPALHRVENAFAPWRTVVGQRLTTDG
jgi:hypothetical protein